LVETIQVFDVDWLAAMSLGLFPLKSVDAATVVNELDQVMGEGGPLGGVLKVVPIERLNALLVVTPQPKYLEDARTWIERLDRTSDVAGRRLYVYHVQNSRAESLAEILSGLFGGQAKSVKAPGPPRLAPGLSGAELTSGGGGRLGAGSMFGSSGTGTSTGLMGQMVMQAAAARPTPPAPAAQAPAPRQPEVDRTPARPGKGAGLEEVGEVSIIADQEHNALVILATPADYEKIESAIKRLDIVPLQVLIEASIIEVTLSNDLSYGVRWWFENKLGNEHSGIGAFRLTGDVPASSIDPGEGFTYAIVNASNLVRAQIDALINEQKGKVLQAPSLMVLDNQTANIRVGDQVPINTGSTTGSAGTTTQTFQFRDTGVLLEVTPRVNAGGLVMMEVSQEVSRSIPDANNPGGNPTIRQRSIATTVAVQSGETVVLGGLIADQEDRGRRGIPGLSKLPVLGALFSTNTTTSARNELLVVITPQAVRDREDARRVTREFRDRLQEIKTQPWAERRTKGLGG
jgi:general secretion pathway protein D